MKKFLLLIFILCLSSNVFSQQPRPRTNYYYYEMDAGELDVIQINVDATVNVFLFDAAAFKAYQNGLTGAAVKPRVFVTTPLRQYYYVVPPDKEHWYLVLDGGGVPLVFRDTTGRLFALNAAVKLFSGPAKGLKLNTR